MKGSCWLLFVCYGGYGSSPLRARVCVLKPCEISSCRLWYIGSEYLHLHSCVRAPFPGVLGPWFHTHSLTHALAPFFSLFFLFLFFFLNFLSHFFCLVEICSPIATNPRTGEGEKGGMGCSLGVGIYIYYRVGACAAAEWFKWIKHKFSREEPKILAVYFNVQFVYVCNPRVPHYFYASFVVERCVLQSKPRCAPPSAW